MNTRSRLEKGKSAVYVSAKWRTLEVEKHSVRIDITIFYFHCGMGQRCYPLPSFSLPPVLVKQV